MRVNHYKYLDKYLPEFFKKLGISWEWNAGIISAHGDKCYSYRDEWENLNIPFCHGVAMYLLTHCSPYSKEVRETQNGWVAPSDWVIANYDGFKHLLPNVDETDKDILSLI